jgi:hypothetical protein
MVDEIEKDEKKDKEEDPVSRCGQAPCVFFEHEELVEYDDAEYGDY